MSVLDLVRPEILSLQSYSSARSEAGRASVMLDANEAPWPPAGLQASSRGLPLNRYPDPQPRDLLERLSVLYDVDPSRILIGRGSDEPLDLLVRAFCRPGVDAIAFSPPTFGMYGVCADVQGANRIEIPLSGDFSVDTRALAENLPASVKLVFLCSPNNPTGGAIALGAIERIAHALHNRAVLVVDEAYVEFADTASAAVLLDKYENLAILRTLSKAWALAGARVGCLLARAEIVAVLRRIMAPYPLPTPSIMAALAALTAEGMALTNRRIALVVAERERMAAELARLPGVLGVLPSSANFLCARFSSSPQVFRDLMASGVVVRDVGRYPRLAGYLRLSVGTREENSRLLEILIRREVSA